MSMVNRSIAGPDVTSYVDVHADASPAVHRTRAELARPASNQIYDICHRTSDPRCRKIPVSYPGLDEIRQEAQLSPRDRAMRRVN